MTIASAYRPRTIRDMPARYIETLTVDPADLQPYPGNAKNHDREALAESLDANGQFRAVLARRTPDGLQLLAGHGTTEAIADTGQPVRVEIVEADDDEARRIVLADNAIGARAGYDEVALLVLLDQANADGGLAGTGYDADTYAELLDQVGSENPHDWQPDVDPDEQDIEPPEEAVTQAGDVWMLGNHRVMCSDSTDPNAVARLLDGATLTLIHADPPYGMGKEADGVLNDNLYGPNLDRFQMQWWTTWKRHLADNGSAYIWGNAPDLWRLWWVGGLGQETDLVMRNEIVWDKGDAIGMNSDGAHSFPVGTERCLFVMRGEQFLGNQNKDDYWEGYEPLRAWLAAEVATAGWSTKDVNRITGKQMAGHWLSQSQFAPIPEADYDVLRDAASGTAFNTPYDALFSQLFPDLRGGGNAHRRELSAQLRERRSYFNNTHDIMRDVWQFPRVQGDDRQGHATPKPVAMVERAFKSSTQKGDAIGIPFGGSGPDIIAAEALGRRAYAMELQPAYCDVIARRWAELTGQTPLLNGEPVDLSRDVPRA